LGTLEDKNSENSGARTKISLNRKEDEKKGSDKHPPACGGSSTRGKEGRGEKKHSGISTANARAGTQKATALANHEAPEGMRTGLPAKAAASSYHL